MSSTASSLCCWVQHLLAAVDRKDFELAATIARTDAARTDLKADQWTHDDDHCRGKGHVFAQIMNACQKKEEPRCSIGAALETVLILLSQGVNNEQTWKDPKTGENRQLLDCFQDDHRFLRLFLRFSADQRLSYDASESLIQFRGYPELMSQAAKRIESRRTVKRKASALVQSSMSDLYKRPKQSMEKRVRFNSETSLVQSRDISLISRAPKDTRCSRCKRTRSSCPLYNCRACATLVCSACKFHRLAKCSTCGKRFSSHEPIRSRRLDAIYARKAESFYEKALNAWKENVKSCQIM